MTTIDWRYHRNGCTTCKRAEAFLDSQKISTKAIIDARKDPLQPSDALKLARSCHTLFVTKGTKVLEFDLKKEKLDDEELQRLLIGPSGKLRAPAIRVKKTLIVGFHPEMMQRALNV
ncbi:MAG TPA: ArsC family (seleno)protein [Pirellulaceae bacterium]|nr:ArsC family (seleno)protein [Pirellulaceae bacterium]HMO93649.1 ArsC family (seleno)protein [Pirellulaceae bacterium]HMP70653.1 ArsC family (seleno)protein [Pirellulaceae bacterium]